MQQFSIPACYFPSTALFIDDSHDFWLNFVLHLDESLAYRIFDSPFHALDCIDKKYRESMDLINATEVRTIHAEIYNPARFSEMSVIIVNQDMRALSGLAFCHRIKNPDIKRILLINQSDESLAAEALGEGLIHCYLFKEDPDVAKSLGTKIYELQFQYFQAISDKITHRISMRSLSCLRDKKFAAFFHQLCQQKGITEYYLADHSGSFLLLNDDARVSFFLVKNEKDMRLHYNLAVENKASEEILTQLSNGEKIPCFGQPNLLLDEWNAWSTCLVPAQRFVADQTYFHAYVHGALLLDIRQEQILSYHHYLDAIDVEELFLV
ncbi:response regulator transcription factor [Legionella fairfieldensis]|uniref:response regulator transcription factor n=1 Tax=Legionella fairfieldensis TaxID=45064 RepID=UPI00048ACFEE|nr:response regulator transcription factor [Legionella fairfieldensis]